MKEINDRLMKDYIGRIRAIFDRIEMRILRYLIELYERSVDTRINTSKKSLIVFEANCRDLKGIRDHTLFYLLDLYTE